MKRSKYFDHHYNVMLLSKNKMVVIIIIYIINDGNKNKFIKDIKFRNQF